MMIGRSRLRDKGGKLVVEREAVARILEGRGIYLKEGNSGVLKYLLRIRRFLKIIRLLKKVNFSAFFHLKIGD